MRWRNREESGANGTTVAGCKFGFMARICSESTNNFTGIEIAPPDENSQLVKTIWPASGRESCGSDSAVRSGGRRIDVRNIAKPMIEAIQLCGNAMGRRTKAAPKKPRKIRKANQEWGFRRGCKCCRSCPMTSAETALRLA